MVVWFKCSSFVEIRSFNHSDSDADKNANNAEIYEQK